MEAVDRPGRFLTATALLLLPVLSGCATARGPHQAVVPPTAATNPREAHALTEFADEVARYAALRDHLIEKGLEKGASDTPEALRNGLAERIRHKRDHAKQGDLFERDIAPLFRRAIAEELSDPSAFDTRRTLGEGNPGSGEGVTPDKDIAPRRITLVANAAYPAASSFSTMPPRLLQRLPSLPPAIDYRFVGRALVLVDTSASLVIDFLPDAVPLGR